MRATQTANQHFFSFSVQQFFVPFHVCNMHASDRVPIEDCVLIAVGRNHAARVELH